PFTIPTLPPVAVVPATLIPPVAPTLVPAATVVPQVVAAAPPLPDVHGPAIIMPSINTVSGISVFPLGERTWDIDPWDYSVGHFQGTPWLTQTGNIVLGGHSKMPDGRPGIFGGLYGLSIGDPIIVQDSGGGTREFVVQEIRTVHYRDVSVVQPTGGTRLTLITCDIPSFDTTTQLYQDRLVVIAVPG
ncbi:MAG: class F sortase, partial [Chloroflexota bacterium]